MNILAEVEYKEGWCSACHEHTDGEIDEDGTSYSACCSAHITGYDEGDDDYGQER